MQKDLFLIVQQHIYNLHHYSAGEVHKFELPKELRVDPSLGQS